MTKKEFLNQYLNAEKEIGIKLDQIARLRELSTKITQTLTPDKGKSNSENRLESFVSKIGQKKRAPVGMHALAQCKGSTA